MIPDLKKNPPADRKKLGSWGECALDEWMSSQGWQRHAANTRIFKGEIDRVYRKEGTGSPSFCLAEIKTRRIASPYFYKDFFCEAQAKNLVKRPQIINLFVWGKQLQAHLRQKGQECRILARIFLILKKEREAQPPPLFSEMGFHLCYDSPSHLILSAVPEEGDLVL